MQVRERSIRQGPGIFFSTIRQERRCQDTFMPDFVWACATFSFRQRGRIWASHSTRQGQQETKDGTVTIEVNHVLEPWRGRLRTQLFPNALDDKISEFLDDKGNRLIEEVYQGVSRYFSATYFDVHNTTTWIHQYTSGYKHWRNHIDSSSGIIWTSALVEKLFVSTGDALAVDGGMTN